MDMKRIIETFERKGFKVSFFESGGEAVKYLCSRLRGKSVGIGGSMTVEQAARNIQSRASLYLQEHRRT